MSRKKQSGDCKNCNNHIEEMVKIIEGAFMEDYNLGCDPCADTVAETLYNAGYRKQREGEWVVEGDYLKTMKCSVCGNTANTVYDKTPYCPNCSAIMKGGEGK